jgi:hypothetical protein
MLFEGSRGRKGFEVMGIRDRIRRRSVAEPVLPAWERARNGAAKPERGCKADVHMMRQPLF